MLTAVKNQIKISLLSVKYAIIREMLNKTTFITNILFMILNNACFMVQWLILFQIKEDFGGYTLKDVLLLWGLSAGTYGISHFFFKKAYHLSDIINAGKLDSFLVQPKNVLLSAITTDVEPSALGDLLYAYIALFIYGFTIKGFILYTIFIILGGIILTAIAVILASLSFWFNKSDIIADTGNSLMIHFSTYPEGIFKGITKVLLYTIIPVGITAYIPVKIMENFNILHFSIIIIITIISIITSFLIFNKGLKKYSSSNLMIAKI